MSSVEELFEKIKFICNAKDFSVWNRVDEIKKILKRIEGEEAKKR